MAKSSDVDVMCLNQMELSMAIYLFEGLQKILIAYS
jgi:hypothetical protein